MKFLGYVSTSDTQPPRDGWGEACELQLMSDGSLMFDLRGGNWRFLRIVPVPEAADHPPPPPPTPFKFMDTIDPKDFGK